MLTPCPSCRRHVRAEERACPFCAASFGDGLPVRAVPIPQRRLSRAAAIAFAGGVAVAGCSAQPLYGAPEPVSDAAIYGAPVDAADAGPTVDVAIYGAPINDAADAAPPDTTGPAPAYGLPPSDGGP